MVPILLSIPTNLRFLGFPKAHISLKPYLYGRATPFTHAPYAVFDSKVRISGYRYSRPSLITPESFSRRKWLCFNRASAIAMNGITRKTLAYAVVHRGRKPTLSPRDYCDQPCNATRTAACTPRGIPQQCTQHENVDAR